MRLVDEEFDGKRVLVTGATGGIGRRVCRLIGERGGEVVAVGRNEEELRRLNSLVNDVEQDTSRIFVVDFDDDLSTASCVEAIVRMSRGLDGVVLIVPSVPKSSVELPESTDWRAALNLCFVNPLAVLQACIGQLHRNGRVVMVSGIASVEVFPSLPFSNVVRLSWLAECKRLSFVLGSRGIRINTVSLGATLTERFVRRLENRVEEDVPARETPETIPLGEYGDPDDAAHVIVTLLGRFANHLTGGNIIFDGGITRAY